MKSAWICAFMDLVSVYNSKPLNLNMTYFFSANHVLNLNNLKRLISQILFASCFYSLLDFMVTGAYEVSAGYTYGI